MSKYDVKQEVTDKYSLRGRVFHKLREDILSGKYEEHEELKEVSSYLEEEYKKRQEINGNKEKSSDIKYDTTAPYYLIITDDYTGYGCRNILKVKCADIFIESPFAELLIVIVIKEVYVIFQNN